MGTEKDFAFDTSEVEVPVSALFKILLNLKVFFFFRKNCFIYIIGIE